MHWPSVLCLPTCLPAQGALVPCQPRLADHPRRWLTPRHAARGGPQRSQPSPGGDCLGAGAHLFQAPAAEQCSDDRAGLQPAAWQWQQGRAGHSRPAEPGG